jgi:ribosomal subunit interface protein
MPFRISGKNIDIGEALRGRIRGRVADAMTKYFDGGYSGHVTICREGFGFRTECVIHLDSGTVLEADALAADAYASADQAALRIENRLRRYKRRLKDRQAAPANGAAHDAIAIDAASDITASPESDSDAEIAKITGFNPLIVAEMTTALKQFSVSEAAAELDLTGAAAVVFRHAGHGRVNLVYRRADGHIGWVDPPPIATGDAIDGPKTASYGPPP